MRLRIYPMLCTFLLVCICLSACGDLTTSPPTQHQTRYLVVQVSQGTYPGYLSPFLAVDPHDPRNLLGAAWFRPSKMSYLVRIGTFVSFDGGRTWHENGLLPVPSGYAESVDETIAFTAGGTGFVTAVVRQNQHDSSPSALAVWRTNDGGRHFTQPLLIEQGNYLANPSLAIDRTDHSGAGIIYLAWKHHAVIEFSRSIDNGRSFARPSVISRASDVTPNWPIILVGPTGSVHVIYLAHDWLLPGSTINEVSSSDQGQHFQTPQLVIKFPGTGENGPRLPSTEAAAVDPRDGTFYITFVAATQMPGHTDIELISSRNAGQSWSTPVRVNDNPVADQVTRFQPQVVVQTNGVVDVFYLALTTTGLGSFLARSTTHGSSFEHPEPITNGTQPLSNREVLVGERQGLALGAQNVYPFWSDIRGGRPEVFTTIVPAV